MSGDRNGTSGSKADSMGLIVLRIATTSLTKEDCEVVEGEEEEEEDDDCLREM